MGRNICHGSDSVENAEKEIKLYVVSSSAVAHPLTLSPRWFPEGTVQYKLTQANVIYE